MAKNTYFRLSICFCFIHAIVFSQSGHILFGERDLQTNKLAIYIDKEGGLYPDFFISNSSLDSCDASLIKWYQKHLDSFFVISKKYNCHFETCNLQNINFLNDSIISSVQQKINAKGLVSTSLTFLIHGYRKPFVKSNNDRTSQHDYATLEETINRSIKTEFVEVYWDAMYDCCYSTNSKKNKELYHLLEESEKNSVPVGFALRKILLNVKSDTVNIITHSLGAQVALNALFDKEDFYISTPSNSRINICLIAPALSEESFKGYYDRKTNSDFKFNDNYKLMIGYNENDFVLRKKVGWFGPGPYKYVNTTLGCNHKGCTVDFKKQFEKNYKNSTIKLFDLSSVGQCHLVSCYCSSGHLKEMLECLH
ncbi:hypothetical protein BH10BAC1_BH10BAC1_06110 [soil metagenome]